MSPLFQFVVSFPSLPLLEVIVSLILCLSLSSLPVCEKDVQKVCANPSQEYLQPFKEKMEGFISTGESRPFIWVKTINMVGTLFHIWSASYKYIAILLPTLKMNYRCLQRCMKHSYGQKTHMKRSLQGQKRPVFIQTRSVGPFKKGKV